MRHDYTQYRKRMAFVAYERLQQTLSIAFPNGERRRERCAKHGCRRERWM